MQRKILVLTSTRAEYGLLKGTIQEIIKAPPLDLVLVVTGTHLSIEYGNTIEEIKEDGVHISYCLPTLELDRGSVNVVKTMSNLQLELDLVLKKENPHIVVLLGDRYEIFSAASVCLINGIPVAHIHGGELTFGAVDDAFRHSISKMSWWHFVTTEEYRQRVIKLGENPKRVFNTGAPAVDNLSSANLSVNELEKFINLKLKSPIFLATFHPETLSSLKTEEQVRILWEGILEAKPGTLIFTKANADKGGAEANSILEKLFKSKDAPYGKLVSSLGHTRYLSLLKLSDVAVGNSSSLVIEAPMLGTPSVNVGDRQAGRFRPPSVLDVSFDRSSISAAIKRIHEPTFKENIYKSTFAFGEPGVAKRIVDRLIKEELPHNLAKVFYE